MCKFFSCISDGKGNISYFDWELRKRCLSGEFDYSPDSHTSIAHHFKMNEDKCNKFEYNPLTQYFEVDQINTTDDTLTVGKKVMALDFTTIIPSLRIKAIYNPLLLPQKEVTSEEIDLLHKWASVRDSVGDSVLWDSVGDSVWDSVGDSVWDSVWDSVRASVWASVRDSVGDSVWDSVGDSVWDSVWVQIGSFFTIQSWKYAENLGNDPWYPNNRLWELGFVPSFDGKTWRLHSGPKAEIVYEWTPDK